MSGSLFEDIKAMEKVQNDRLEKVLQDYSRSLDELAASRSEVKSLQHEIADLKKVVEILLQENSALKHRYAAVKRWNAYLKRELEATAWLYCNEEQEKNNIKKELNSIQGTFDFNAGEIQMAAKK